MVQKTGSGIGNDKNPVFLAEINSGNRPYCRFFHTFVGTEAPEIIRSDKRFRCFFHFFHIERCFRKIHVFPLENMLSAIDHDTVFVCFVHRIQTAVEALRHPREAGNFDVFRQIMVDCLQKFFIG